MLYQDPGLRLGSLPPYPYQYHGHQKGYIISVCLYAAFTRDAGSKTIPGTPSRPRLLGCVGPVRRSICGLAHTRALEHLIKIVRWAREELARARAFTQYNKRVSKLKSNIGTLIDKDGVLQTDPKIMADLLQHQYTSVFSDPNCPLKKSPLLKLKHPAAC